MGQCTSKYRRREISICAGLLCFGADFWRSAFRFHAEVFSSLCRLVSQQTLPSICVPMEPTVPPCILSQLLPIPPSWQFSESSTTPASLFEWGTLQKSKSPQCYCIDLPAIGAMLSFFDSVSEDWLQTRVEAKQNTAVDIGDWRFEI